MTEVATELFAALRRVLAQAAALRERLHAAPQLSGTEHATTKLLAEHFPDTLELIPVADAGAAVRIGGPGPAVAIRAELDALPVTERTGSRFAARTPGAMHACGHDVHLAALWAVAHAVSSVEQPAPLLALFQPREEAYPSGARDVLDSGLLGELGCRQMIGVHVQPALEPGVVACVAGAVNASCDQFTLTMTGRPGHAAYPHRAVDPVVALAGAIVAMQSIPSRWLDPMDAAVLGVSMLRAGQAPNTIPDSAEATGTFRALSPAARETMHRRLGELVTSIAQAHGCAAELDVTRGEPVLVNDRELAIGVAQRLRAHGVDVVDDYRSVGSDDFSYYCEAMPAAMFFVGTDARESLHAPTFLPTEADLGRVAETMLHAYLVAAGV